ncbi:MAG: hypothetical protein KKD75_00975 [Nanoarchaeota archaeon]|nr:hypothetical protein [Nanoarchaeota archaeon]MBU1631878.1 hypothetical protein [Nanoarchaeota archaeon]MBU1875935.1 hypothetical protein [Nanoarchaeota archaeon]
MTIDTIIGQSKEIVSNNSSKGETYSCSSKEKMQVIYAKPSDIDWFGEESYGSSSSKRREDRLKYEARIERIKDALRRQEESFYSISRNDPLSDEMPEEFD